MSLEIDSIGVDNARRLTERIRLTATSARESITKLAELLDAAKTGNAHVAMGYKSWPAYVTDVLGPEPMRLPKEQRQELAGFLSGKGMSTRAIAPIVGASQKTVNRDTRNTGESNDSPDTPVPEPPAAAPIVTGLDGKTYPTKPTKPASQPTPKPNRKPLVDDARAIGLDLQKVIDRIERFAADDRLHRNKDEVAAHLRYHLDHALTVCQGLNDVLNS